MGEDDEALLAAGGRHPGLGGQDLDAPDAGLKLTDARSAFLQPGQRELTRSAGGYDFYTAGPRNHIGEQT